MLKLRVSLAIGGIAGFLTFLFAILHDARLTTLVYRTIVSSLLFGLTGLAIGIALDKVLTRIRLENAEVGKNIDMTIDMETSHFHPFTPDTVERISRPD